MMNEQRRPGHDPALAATARRPHPSDRGPACWAGWCLRGLFVSALISFSILSAAPASAQSVWELTPYRIRLIVAMQPSPGLGPRLQSDLEERLLSRFETVIGAAWDVSTEPASVRLRNCMTENIADVTADLLPKDSQKFDKIMLLAINTGPVGYRVFAREFDVRTQVFSCVAELPVAQISKLRDASFQAVWQAFAPLARIAESKGKNATLKLRAGGLSMRDKTLAGVGDGDIFRPLIRYIDREGNLRRVVEVPWTFLVVEKFESRSFKCKVHSAMRSPLTGRRRGRVEQLALAVRPAGQSTRLTLRARFEPHQLLCGYDISARLPGSKKTAPTTPVGRTDGHGTVTIPSIEECPLLILVVKSGSVLLARLPVVPGLSPSLTANVPGVDKRLEAEGFITGLQEELIDLVTRREVLIIRAEKYIATADWDQARAVVNELRSLQTRAELLRVLDREREKISVKDKWTKKKIEILFGDTRKLLHKFLAPEAIDRIAGEVVRAREESRGDSQPQPDSKGPLE